ncbi:MAG: phosphatidylglycerol lysyltransferase domain-containing protein [Pirellulaceae bacterium]
MRNTSASLHIDSTFHRHHRVTISIDSIDISGLNRSMENQARRYCNDQQTSACERKPGLSLYSPDDCESTAIGSLDAGIPAPSDSIVVSHENTAFGNSQTYWAHHSHIPKGHKCQIVAPKDRELALRGYGNFSLAYSTAVQPRLEHFGDERGYIAFARRNGVTFVLGDPVADQQIAGELLQQFLKQYRSPSFVNITENTARVLSNNGFWVNEIGVDTRLDLRSLHFRGKENEWLRYADNWTRRRGMQVREFSADSIRHEIELVSEAWRTTRTVRRKEVRFLNRPIVVADEVGVRRFGLFESDGSLQAFVFFDPLFKDNQIVGYVTCIKRRRPECNGYVETAIVKRAMEVFQSENIPSLWLGLSPFYKIENETYRSNRWMHHTTRYYHQAKWFNRWLYNFQGHSEYKKRFAGEEHKIYYASRVRWNTFRFLTLASLCGVF